MLCEFAGKLDGFKACSPSKSLDQEIYELRMRYIRLLNDELETLIAEENAKIERLRLEIADRDEMIGELREEIGFLKGILKMMKK